MEVFLKFLLHILGYLPDAMEGRIPHLGVCVLEVLDDNWDHRLYLADVLHVLAHLRESHQSCVFVPPIVPVCQEGLDQNPEEREHFFLANRRYETVDALLAEGYIVFFFLVFIIIFEPFLGSHPTVLNVFINVYHKFENKVKYAFQQCFVPPRD